MDSTSEPRLAWRARLGAGAVLLGVLLVFFAPAIFGPGQFLFRDNGRMHWPMKQYIAERLQAGELPQWNPYGGLGVPILAGAIDAVLHPFNLLLTTLPFPVAFKAWALLSYVLAATGAYAWARALDRSRPAAVAAGLGFALSGSLVGSSDNLTYLTTLAALPWVFAAAHAWFLRGGAGRLALLGLASWLCAAGGDPQAWGFALALLPAYGLCLLRGSAARLRLGRSALAAVAAVIAAAPVILPVLAWMPESSRAETLTTFELNRWALPLPRLLELALPHMYRDEPGLLASPVYMAYGGGEETQIPWVVSVYVGISAIVLAVVGMARAPAARWLVATAAVFTWMALGPHAGFGRVLPHLPILSGFRYWEKMAIWPSLLIPMAAAFGLDALARGRGRNRAALWVAVCGVAAALLASLAPFRAVLTGTLARAGVAATTTEAFAGNIVEGLMHAGTVAAVLGLAVLAIAHGWVRRSTGPLLALVVVADVFAANVRGYVLADPAVADQRSRFAEHLRDQDGLQRVFTPFELTPDRWPDLRQFEAGWMWAGHMLESPFNVREHVGHFDPYTGMLPDRVDRFQRRAPVAERFQRLGLFGVGYMPVPIKPELAATARLPPPYDVVARDLRLPAYLLRIPHRDRAYLASTVRSVERREALEFALAASSATSDVSVVEAPLPIARLSPGLARIVVDEAERVVVETATSGGPALLILNDTYASGWSARVDGRSAAIVPANYLVRGVWVDEGRHVVEFDYRTPGFGAGLVITTLGAVALATAALIRSRGRRVRQ